MLNSTFYIATVYSKTIPKTSKHPTQKWHQNWCHAPYIISKQHSVVIILGLRYWQQ